MDGFKIDFKDRYFCFTGKLKDVERSEAHAEVKYREGFIAKDMNGFVDYLVVGDIPNPSWKFGSFGTKMNKAINLRKATGKPLIIREETFLEHLSEIIPLSSEIKSFKIIQIKAHFFTQTNQDAFLGTYRAFINKFATKYGYNIIETAYPTTVYANVFDNHTSHYDDDKFYTQYSLTKKVESNFDTLVEIAELKITSDMHKLRNVFISYSEYGENSMMFKKLLK